MRLSPMCKVKQVRCPGVLLESKPVSYSWYTAQVRPLHILPKSAVISGSTKAADMIFIYSQAVCWEYHFK
jgi:hypothetical protein